ncbi:MAG: hypothetical protein AAGM38_15095 [Pseudomonadota bacterium]
MSTTKINKDGLRRLVPALDAVKERDAAALRVKTLELASLEAEIARLEDSILEAAAQLAPGDFAAETAYLRFRDLTRGHIDRLTPRREALIAERDAAREVLARSYGKLEGVSRLLERPDPARRGV